MVREGIKRGEKLGRPLGWVEILFGKKEDADAGFPNSITKASISSLIGNQTRAGNITMAAVTATLSNGSTFATTVPAVVVNGTTVTSGVTPLPTEVSSAPFLLPFSLPTPP